MQWEEYQKINLTFRGFSVEHRQPHKLWKMKKLQLVTSVIIISLVMTSFKPNKSEPTIITISVSGDPNAQFDMIEEVNAKEGLVMRSQSVPFEMKIKVSEAKFTFK